jgi:hypothetical protein
MSRNEPRDDGPIDFGPMLTDRLDADRSAARWASLVGRIEAAAAPELARRAARAGGTWLVDNVSRAVARFAAPALIAAAAAIFAAVGTSGSSDPVPSELVASQAISDEAAQQALSLGERADWITQQEAPSVDDLARAIDPGARSSVGEPE